MSTITVVRKNGQAAIAADTMTKWGSHQETSAYVVSHSKILEVGGSYLAVTGATSAKLVLKDYFAGLEHEPELGSVEGIFGEWLTLHHALRERYFLRPYEDEDDSFESTRVDVLIANRHGIFGVSAHRAVQEFSRFFAYGDGDEFALGAMFAVYDDPSKSAQEIAELGVRAAAEFNDGTGLPAVSYTVALNGPG